MNASSLVADVFQFSNAPFVRLVVGSAYNEGEVIYGTHNT
jgi:hypothetical protein